jgi:hypothetical protein
VVAAPLLTLLHEVGHATTAAVLTGARATVVQGGEPSRVRFSIWRLDFELRPVVGLRTAWYGYVQSEAETTRARRAVIHAAGPVVSLLAFVLLSLLARSLSFPASWFVWAAAWGAGWQFVATATPIRYGPFFGPYSGRRSDGRRILELLRERS